MPILWCWSTGSHQENPENSVQLRQWPSAKFRALLIVKQHLSAHIKESREVMIQQEQKQAEYYDHTAQQLPELQQNQSVCIHLDPEQPTWQRVMVTRTPTYRTPWAYQVQTSSEAGYIRNRMFICPGMEPDSPGPTTPEVPVVLSTPQMNRSLPPTQAPSVHTATPRTTLPQPQQLFWPPQRLIEVMP